MWYEVDENDHFPHFGKNGNFEGICYQITGMVSMATTLCHIGEVVEGARDMYSRANDCKPWSYMSMMHAYYVLNGNFTLVFWPEMGQN